MVSVCLPSDAPGNTYHLTWVSLTLDVGYLFTAAPAKQAAAPYLGWGVSPDHCPSWSWMWSCEWVYLCTFIREFLFAVWWVYVCNFVFSVYESMSEEASVCMLHVGVSLYMCAYIYMHSLTCMYTTMHTHACTCIFLHVCTQMHIYVCLAACTQTHLHTCTQGHIHIYLHRDVYTSTYVCMHKHAHRHAQTHMQVYMHTNIHTRI